MAKRKTILTAAITGNLTRSEQNPRLPVTPEQIARAALDAAAEGAAIVHLHVRDPDTAKGSMRLDLYEELVDRIRAEDRNVLINLTTGEGGRFVPTPGDPRTAASGSTLCPPEQRVAHVEALKPDICTLDLNTMWSGQASVINSPDNIRIMANRIYASGVTPEIELFDTGDLQLMRHLMDDGTLATNLMVQLVLGVRFGAMATPQNLAFLVSALPDGIEWAGFAVGRAAFPMLAQSFLLGGHVRIGMEDTLYIARGELCRDNAQLVTKAALIINSLGGDLASPADARSILGITQSTLAREPA
jgi:uncharacterized protein (DUF849 family)